MAALLDGWSGADIDCATDGSGKSPLHQAASRGRRRTVELLLDQLVPVKLKPQKI